MAYSQANLRMLQQVTAPTSWRTWLYSSTDTFATVRAANYISNPAQMGMAVHDLIYVLCTGGTPTMTLARILTVTASGATMSQTGLPVVDT
jgi:hypothetical protein